MNASIRTGTSGIGNEHMGPINIVTATNFNQVSQSNPNPPAKIDAPKVVNMNQATLFPDNVHRKKNKNDFYRFLLQ